MSELTREQIAEIRARADAADKGPWITDLPGPDAPSNYCALCKAVGSSPSLYAYGDDPRRTNNITFAAHAREDVPNLCDDLTAALDRAEAAERENERLRGLDTDRLDWLEQICSLWDTSVGQEEFSKRFVVWWDDLPEQAKGHTLREAIDTAICQFAAKEPPK